MNEPKNVIILTYHNLCLFEFACALEVFGQNRPEFEEEHYRLKVCRLDIEQAVDLESISIAPIKSCGLDEISKADLVIVPGWQGIDVKPTLNIIESLRAAHANKTRIASICSGAFLLAYAGLLDGRRATTHWGYLESAQKLFPNVMFDTAVLYTDDNGIITSAGSAAGLDMCLHIVRSDYGQHVANSYARRLVIPPFRDGGQAQFIQQPMPPDSQDNRFAKLLSIVEANLAQHYSVQKMAEIVNLSERHFQRQFKTHFAITPGKWLTRVRLHNACDLLETTDLPIKKIVQLCGLGSEESLRHHFRHILKTSPSDYRKAFSSQKTNA